MCTNKKLNHICDVSIYNTNISDCSGVPHEKRNKKKKKKQEKNKRHFQFLKYQGQADTNLEAVEAQNSDTQRIAMEIF